MNPGMEFVAEAIEDNKIKIVHKNIRHLKIDDAFKELDAIKRDIAKLQQTELQIKEMIEHKKLEQDLVNTQENLKLLQKFEAELEILTKPRAEELEKKIRQKVKVAKAEKGYGRISDQTQKTVLQNQILGPIVAEEDIDITHPVVRKVKVDFDKI